mmetsp:Transcript_6386/g.17306  ORF Transcript_6386/g.17306 Transcript_6386/m.17306 type:complete len:226 (-) Transcript_6386:918-1595(-)
MSAAAPSAVSPWAYLRDRLAAAWAWCSTRRPPTTACAGDGGGGSCPQHSATASRRTRKSSAGEPREVMKRVSALRARSARSSAGDELCASHPPSSPPRCSEAQVSGAPPSPDAVRERTSSRRAAVPSEHCSGVASSTASAATPEPAGVEKRPASPSPSPPPPALLLPSPLAPPPAALASHRSIAWAAASMAALLAQRLVRPSCAWAKHGADESIHSARKSGSAEP